MALFRFFPIRKTAGKSRRTRKKKNFVCFLKNGGLLQAGGEGKGKLECGLVECASEIESERDRAGVHELAVVLFGFPSLECTFPVK